MKRALSLALCLLFLCGCNSKITLKDFFDNESEIIIVNSDSFGENTSSDPISFKTGVYLAKKLTSYSDDMIYPKTAYTSIPKEEYMYYRSLNSNMKKLYNTLCEHIECMSDGFIDLGAVTDDDIAHLITCIRSDRPEYFWLGRDYVINTKSNGQKQVAFKFKSEDYSINYLYSVSERNKILSTIKSKLSSLESVVINKLEYARELAIHDFVVNNCTYDDTALKNSDSKPYAYNIVGPFTQKKAVCEGYARTIQLINNHFGIKTSVVVGTASSGNHMWNIVKIDGDYYYLDATFNDSNDKIMYSYFNISTKVLNRSHKLDSELYSKVKLPAVNTLAKSYFTVNNTLLDYDMNLTVLDAIERAVQHYETSIDFGYSDNAPAIAKSLEQLKENGVNIMQYFDIIYKNRNIKVYDVGISFATNGNFKIYWSY